MTHFIPVETEEHKNHVRELNFEYLTYVRQNVLEEFGVDFDVPAQVEQDMRELNKLLPPDGRLFLVEHQGQIAGLGGLRQIREGVGEVKRFYIRPAFQGQGLGRKLLETLIAEARKIGYQKLRLDVGPYSKAAEKLYRSSGFSTIPPYPETEAPPEVHSRWTFMEMAL